MVEGDRLEGARLLVMALMMILGLTIALPLLHWRLAAPPESLGVGAPGLAILPSGRPLRHPELHHRAVAIPFSPHLPPDPDPAGLVIPGPWPGAWP